MGWAAVGMVLPVTRMLTAEQEATRPSLSASVFNPESGALVRPFGTSGHLDRQIQKPAYCW